jgi:hypothetical protein
VGSPGTKYARIEYAGSPVNYSILSVPQQLSDVEDKAQCLVNGLYLCGAHHSLTR